RGGEISRGDRRGGPPERRGRESRAADREKRVQAPAGVRGPSRDDESVRHRPPIPDRAQTLVVQGNRDWPRRHEVTEKKFLKSALCLRDSVANQSFPVGPRT